MSNFTLWAFHDEGENLLYGNLRYWAKFLSELHNDKHDCCSTSGGAILPSHSSRGQKRAMLRNGGFTEQTRLDLKVSLWFLPRYSVEPPTVLPNGSVGGGGTRRRLLHADEAPVKVKAARVTWTTALNAAHSTCLTIGQTLWWPESSRALDTRNQPGGGDFDQFVSFRPVNREGHQSETQVVKLHQYKSDSLFVSHVTLPLKRLVKNWSWMNWLDGT